MTEGGSVAKCIGITAFYGEITILVYELRWLFVLVAVLISADLWFGIRESRRVGQHVRGSRAARRTVNKFVDYMMWTIVASIIGMCAETAGLGDHVQVAAIGVLLAAACEVSSIVGHLAALRGIKFSTKQFLLSWLKRKNNDIGESVEEGLKDDSNYKE